MNLIIRALSALGLAFKQGPRVPKIGHAGRNVAKRVIAYAYCTTAAWRDAVIARREHRAKKRRLRDQVDYHIRARIAANLVRTRDRKPRLATSVHAVRKRLLHPGWYKPAARLAPESAAKAAA